MCQSKKASMVMSLNKINTAEKETQELTLLVLRRNYMKLLNKPKGMLLNFCCTNIFKEGQRTYVNELYASLPD